MSEMEFYLYYGVFWFTCGIVAMGWMNHLVCREWLFGPPWDADYFGRCVIIFSVFLMGGVGLAVTWSVAPRGISGFRWLLPGWPPYSFVVMRREICPNDPELGWINRVSIQEIYRTGWVEEKMTEAGIEGAYQAEWVKDES